MICFDMRQIEQNNLKKEAAKRPKKIQRYSMMMLICIMIIYLVVLCTEVMPLSRKSVSGCARSLRNYANR